MQTKITNLRKQRIQDILDRDVQKQYSKRALSSMTNQELNSILFSLVKAARTEEAYRFNVNQIVKGKVCGHFIVLGYRTMNESLKVQVKPYCPVTQKALPGEMAFDEEALQEAI